MDALLESRASLMSGGTAIWATIVRAQWCANVFSAMRFVGSGFVVEAIPSTVGHRHSLQQSCRPRGETRM